MKDQAMELSKTFLWNWVQKLVRYYYFDKLFHLILKKKMIETKLKNYLLKYISKQTHLFLIWQYKKMFYMLLLF